ncbi:hypothetical protein P6B95_04945 [Streptomyces atratus]|nr:hypothetical protein [Streptomyces atratus]WPW26820.1 hypothetical protein P6B95_04945 [Streptomyces atratus]GGT75784.1 hypothetical protein GCM10010207_86050 [Streptomyces atratus]
MRIPVAGAPRLRPQDIGDVPGFDLLAITHSFETYQGLEPGKSADAFPGKATTTRTRRSRHHNNAPTALPSLGRAV